MMSDDMDLVREFAIRHSESAFETLVSRYVNLVHSVARRRVEDPHLAEEITQAVFVILARKANSLGPKTILPAWLYRTAQFVSADALKTRHRQQRRDHEAYMQSSLNEPESNPWTQIAPLLEPAMEQLSDKDRTAIVLRFFEGRALKDVGAALGTGEDSARMRINRALEKLREFFAKRGVSSTAAILADVIAANSVYAAPPAMVKSVMAIAVTKSAAASVSTSTLIKGALKIMAWTKAKSAMVAGAGILLVAGATSITAIKLAAHHRYRDSWRSAGLNSSVLARTTPQTRILPSKFRPPVEGLAATADSRKWGGLRVQVRAIAWAAYGWRPARIMFPDGEPQERYDFISTLNQGAEEALQKELKEQVGYVGQRETREVEVLKLRVRRPNAPGLKPPIPGGGSDWMVTGHYHCDDRPLATEYPEPAGGLSKFLEVYFGIPAIDETGLTQHFQIDLEWNELGARDPNHELLKRALLDQLGLEVVASRAPVEMLVLTKAK